MKAVQELESLIKKEAAREKIHSMSSKRTGQSSKRTSESSEHDDKVKFYVVSMKGVLTILFKIYVL